MATHSVSGGTGIASTVINYFGAASGSVTADGSGNYTISNLADGTYHLEPVLDGHNFEPFPLIATLAGSNLTGQNFTATAVSYVIDDRTTPNQTVNVAATPQFTVTPSLSHAQPVDSRAAGVPVDSRTSGNIPVNSRK